MTEDSLDNNPLSEEERYENLKKMLGDDADKYFSGEIPRSSGKSGAAVVSYGMTGPTKFLILMAIVFGIVMVGAFMAVQDSQNTTITIEAPAPRISGPEINPGS